MTRRWCVLLLVMATGCNLGAREIPDADPGGVNTPSTACSTVCHGSLGEAAPPRDTGGRTETSAVGVGAHRQHLGSSPWHKRIECATCHVVPTQIGEVGHLDTPLPAELTFSGLAAGAEWDRASESCSNNYCHGATLTNSVGMGASASAGGDATTPVWTLVDGSQSQCGSCHGYPPPAPHPPGDDCGQCHPTMNPGAGMVIAYPELHVDGHLDVVNTAACDSCHGQNGQSAPPKDTTGGSATSLRGVGAHAQHMVTSSSWHAPINCVECHAVPAGVNDLGHIDTPTPAEITWGPTAGNGAWNGATCTNTYCHGGPGTMLVGGAATSPQWTQVDGTQTQCGSCHGAPPGDAVHASATPTNCGNCHPTMNAGSTTIALPALHIDGKVDVSNGQACNACHGSASNDAPPRDTQGNTSTSVRSVGAHQVHVAASSWRKAIGCDACHRVPGAVSAIGHTDTPLPAELTFGTLAGNPTWNGSTCANAYCHGATLAGGTSKNPAWTTITGAQSQCGSCHGEPPPAPHPADSDCGKCHDTMTAGMPGVITDPARHIDGNLDVAGDLACNACHGSATSGAGAPPKDVNGNTATTARGVGAHQQHLAVTNRARTVLCSDCHAVPGAVGSVGHRDTPLPAELRFSTLAGTGTAWNGSRCSNSYCHGATLNAGGTATAPIWTTVNGTQATCTSCHGNPPNDGNHTATDTNCGVCHPNVQLGSPTTFTTPGKHVDGNVDVTGGQACSTCHGTAGVNDAPPKDTTGGTGTNLRGVGAHQVHLAIDTTRYRAMTCAMCHTVPTATNSAGHRDTPLPAELNPTGVAAGTTFNGATCSSYCHGSTMGGIAPTWTSTSDMTCVSCHGNPPPAPHPQSATCQGCHDTAGATANSIAKPMQHIDGVTQTQNVHPTGYSAREQHGHEADSKGFSTCATASCHGTTLLGGTTGGPSCSSCHPASWQTTCTFCHGASGQGAPPAGVLGATAQSDKHVGAHAEHVTAATNHAAIACTSCHTLPTSATSPGHVDGTGGVVQAEVKFGSLNPSATFNVTTTVCSNLYCHGNGRTSAGTGTWTSTTALTCTSCHPTTALASGEHSKHIQGEGMKCSECHSTVVNATPAVINPALHVNGLKEVKLSPIGTWTASTKSCSGLPGGCHGTKTW